MKTHYTQEIFDSCMTLLTEKEEKLLEYLQLTRSISHDNLVDELEGMLAKRKNIIAQMTELDHQLAAVAKKPFGNESQALLAILKHKTPEDAQLPPFLQPIDNKCKIIYNILCSIQVADEELNAKVQFVKENLFMQIEQVKNSKQIFGYSQTSTPASLGNVLDKKQ